MTVAPRPVALHPQVESFLELQSLLDVRLAAIEHDLADDETAAAMGMRLKERRAVYLDIAWAIREVVAHEADDLQAMLAVDAEEARWKDDPSLGAGASVEAFRG